MLGRVVVGGLATGRFEVQIEDVPQAVAVARAEGAGVVPELAFEGPLRGPAQPQAMAQPQRPATGTSLRGPGTSPSRAHRAQTTPPSARHLRSEPSCRTTDATDTESGRRRSYGQSGSQFYNAVRPHGAVRYRAPSPKVLVPGWAAWPGCAAGGLWTSGQPGYAGLTPSPQAQQQHEQSILTVLPTSSPTPTMEPRPTVN